LSIPESARRLRRNTKRDITADCLPPARIFVPVMIMLLTRKCQLSYMYFSNRQHLIKNSNRYLKPHKTLTAGALPHTPPNDGEMVINNEEF